MNEKRNWEAALVFSNIAQETQARTQNQPGSSSSIYGKHSYWVTHDRSYKEQGGVGQEAWKLCPGFQVFMR